MRAGRSRVRLGEVDGSVAVSEGDPLDDILCACRLLRAETGGSCGAVLTVAQLENASVGVEEVLDRFVVDFEVRHGEREVDLVRLGTDAGEEVLHDEEDDSGLGWRTRDSVGFTATGGL
jgi:hypothetical protein